MSSVSNSYVKQVLKQVKFIVDHRSIKRELNSHITDLIDEHQWQSLPEEELNQHVQEEMGNPNEIGKELNKVHHPILGYAWFISRILLIFVGILGLYLFLNSIGVAYSASRIPTFNTFSYEQINAIFEESESKRDKDKPIIIWDINKTIELSTQNIVFDKAYLHPANKLIISYRIYYNFDITNSQNFLYLGTFSKIKLDNNQIIEADKYHAYGLSYVQTLKFDNVPYNTKEFTLSFEQVNHQFSLDVSGYNYETK